MSTRLLSSFRTLAAALLVSLALVRPAAAVDWTDIWWNPAEAGWGVTFTQADNFIFATFFVYDANKQPIWYTGNMTVDANGVWSGPLYLTNGSFYGDPWDPSKLTQNQVGTVTFRPANGSANSYSGTLTYNVGGTNVTKQIQRQTLTTIPGAGNYSGAVLSIFSGCDNPANNGPVTYFSNLTVAQVVGGAMTFSFTGFTADSSFTFVIAGTYVQNGQLYRVPNANYAAGNFNFAAVVSEVKVTSQGIEGRWTASVAPAFAGCVENAYFSQLFIN
jgi:hypothetical protein